MPKLSGTKGEWSEIYVFLRLLEGGKLYAADMNLRFEIVKTLVVNLFTQKWDNADQVIVFEAK